MEMCNRTLSEVLKKNPQGVPFADVAQVGLHVVSRKVTLLWLTRLLHTASLQLSVLKELHLKGFVYVDIKTDNIMVGNAVSEHQVCCTHPKHSICSLERFRVCRPSCWTMDAHSCTAL